jgi:hypothetical protein
MNWSHRLLQLWAVVTVLWIGFCGYRLVADWPDLSTSRVVIVFDRVAPFHSNLAPTTTVPPEAIAKAKKEAATWHKRIVQAHVLRIAMKAILQPAALLVSGVIVLWIARRFRKF